MNNDKRTILITGAAGYVGEMLCDQLAKRDDVERIIALDKDEQTKLTKSLEKVLYIQANLAEAGWQNKVIPYMPDTIVHTAWQIRTLYGREKEQWRLNVEASEAVFNFAFANRFVKKLIYFSTAASYSARPENSIEHYFTEAEGLRDDDYLYAKEKKVVEEKLYNTYSKAQLEEKHYPQITVLRPAAITGPKGRFMTVRFGLQSALRGDLKGGFLNKLVSLMTSYMPATTSWARQFVHEDDVLGVVTHLIFSPNAWSYEVFNLTPNGKPVLADEMAKIVDKKVLMVPSWMVRLSFWSLWHLTRGRIPTSQGVWRVYSYPILMSGDKLTVVYRCRYSSLEAISTTAGNYEYCVPEAEKVLNNLDSKN
ncbi:MAG: NAD-dependent epimerase/dehydratase family protein [Candidatus Paceibacterota bacterium]